MVEKAKADLELVQQTYDRQAQLLERKVVAQATLDTALRNLDQAKQNVVAAQAAAERARLAFTVEIGGVNTAVARLQADLRNAEFDLSETSVRAPTNGYITQSSLARGWRWPIGAPINRVSGVIDERAVGLASSADDRTLPVVCAIAPGLLSRVSNAIVVIKFRMIGSPNFSASRAR
jgi:multidrug resistance efflux pump